MREHSFMPIIAKIIALCGITKESAIACFFIQHGWNKLDHVTVISVVKDFAIFCKDESVKA
jgi:uncharacterized membrane protein YbaN (DUF454 family)